MKKLCLILFILVIAVTTYADTTHKETGGLQYVTQLITVTEDATSIDLGKNLCGGYLFSVEVKSTVDDAFTVSIASRLGTVLFTRTTTAATSGHIYNPTGYWPMNCVEKDSDYPTYTISGLSGGTVYIEVTVCKS